MITAESKIYHSDKEAQISFKGLAADTKPTVTFEGLKILNGSSFMEMDTKKLFFYDEENSQWV